MDDMTRRRRNVKAIEIANEVDPKAGGFFHNCLVRAALLGMEYSNPSADEDYPTMAKTLGEQK